MDISSFASLKGKRILIMAEKPSQAKRIFGVLSSALKPTLKTTTRGKSKFNPVYKIVADDNEIIINSVSGFLLKLEYNPPFSKRYKWRLEGTLDKIKWSLEDLIEKNAHWEIGGTGQYLKSNKLIVAQIKDLARSADLFICATDNDFAGELIGYQALETAQKVNKELQALRMIFSSVTYGDILNAWKNLKPMRKTHKEAEESRQRTDLMTGALFTRLLTLLVQERVPGVMISWGGCQTLFLKHIVDKFLAHEQFEPKQFWEVQATIEKEQKEYLAKWKKGKQFERKDAKLCFIQTRREKTGRITKVEKSDWKKYPPVPLRTATMLQRLTKMMRLPAKVVMDTAEALYNKGLISYPRTENEVHPFTFNASKVLEQFKEHTKYGGYTTALLTAAGKRIIPRAGRNKTKDHDPIYPTKSATQQEVEAAMQRNRKVNAWRVYDYIVRHFIATCSKEALFHKTYIELEIGDNFFHLDGKVKISSGFMEIYPFYQAGIKEVPNCVIGDVINVVKVEMPDGWTQAPPYADDSEVIKWASDNNVGTDATYHTHLETVQKRRYVVKNENKKLLPTDLGMTLIKALDAYAPLMVDVELRNKLQTNMDKVAEDKLSMEEVIRDFQNFARKAYHQLMEKKVPLSDDLTNILLMNSEAGRDLGVCGKCGASMHLETVHKYGGKVSRYSSCEGCETKLTLPKEGKITPLIEKICKKCRFTLLKIKNYVICPYCFTQELEKGLFYCSKCLEKDCEFSGSGQLESIRDDEKKAMGVCPKCKEELYAVVTRTKRFAKCSNKSCDFLSRLPRASKGEVTLSNKICPECQTKLFKYRKKYPKGKFGKETYFCVACLPDGKFSWCFNCEKRNECFE